MEQNASIRKPMLRRFALFAWFDLAYNVLVILWGAVVRATGSGAGCGEHWPLCQGVLVPHAARLSTFIEFVHRSTSGIAVALVVALVFFAFRGFPRRHWVRRYAAAALFFTLTEGLLGAALVLLGDVGSNASLSLVILLCLHLVNTFLLLASLALTAQSAIPGFAPQPLHPRGNTAAEKQALSASPYAAYGAGLLAALVIAITGTITALADTLIRPASLAQGWQMDFSKAANPILRLRIIHPAIAVIAGCFLMVLAAHARRAPPSARGKRLAQMLLVLILFQFFLGALNVVLLAPLGLQVLHLLTADLIWITLVLLAAEVAGRTHTVQGVPGQAPTAEVAESVPIER
jgi:heme A synthase